MKYGYVHNTFFCLVLFCCISLNTNAATNPFLLLWGKTAPTEIIFAPFGYHLFDSPNEQYLFDKQFHSVNDAQYLLSFHWKSIAVGTFTNSFGDQVEFLSLYRQVITSQRFDLAYIVGVMTGYGQYADGNGGPSFMHSIIDHDPGLLVALDAKLPITKKIAFHMVCPINFRSIDFGIGYAFSE